MVAIGRGCLEFLLVWALGSLGLFSQLQDKVHRPELLWGIGIGGFLISCGWGLVRNCFNSVQTLRLLSTSEAGARPKDGKVFAIAGRIYALTTPLLTPFLKKPCVAYGYDVFSETRLENSRNSASTSQRTVHLGGYALCPCAVRRGATEVRVLGFPMPTEFAEDRHLVKDFESEVKAYYETTKFDEPGGLGVGAVYKAVKDIFAEDDGSHRYDWKGSRADQVFFDPDTMFMEQFIPHNAEVCVIGVYSQEKQGLLSDISKGGLQVIPGDLARVTRVFRNRSLRQAFGTLVFFGLGILGTSWILLRNFPVKPL